MNRPADRIKIIFAGRALADEVVVGDCDLGQSTVLHAILVKVEEDEAKDEEEAEAQVRESPSSIRRSSNFFVFCGDPCAGLRPGKLRVRCRDCGEGALVLDREPQDWSDVLDAGRIGGRCESAACDGGKDVRAEFFFKCSGHSHRGEEESPPLHMVKRNEESLPCLACLEETSALVVVFDCADRHLVCVDCFADYCRSRLNERSFVLDADLGYTLGCPAGCGDSLVGQTRHFKLAGEAEYARYQRFAAEESVLQAGGVLCPQPGCGMGIMPGEDDDDDSKVMARRVVCRGGCDYVFCRDCLQGYHIGECHAARRRRPGGRGRRPGPWRSR